MSRSFTSQTHDKLVKELAERENVTRREIAAQIRAAKEFGDLSENAAYKDAREAEQYNESRIFYLKNILKGAAVIKEPAGGSFRVIMGVTVKIRRVDTGAEVNYTIVDAAEANAAEGLISSTSPVGRSILGKSAGVEVEVETPKGKVNFQIIEIT